MKNVLFGIGVIVFIAFIAAMIANGATFPGA